MQTGLLTCDRYTPLDVAAARMAERRCSSMLVIENGEAVGIWTEHDCLYLDFADPGALRQPIGELMSGAIAKIAEDTPVSEAVMRFTAENRHHFLVVGGDGAPLGVLSRSDAVLNQGLESYLRLREVHHAMSKTPLVLSGTLTLGELASRMRFSQSDAAVITQPGQPLGIITELTVRLHGLPEAVSAATVCFEDVAGAVDAVIASIQYGIPMARIELLDSLSIYAVNRHSGRDHPEKPTLFLEFHGSAAAVEAQVATMGELCREFGGSDFAWATRDEERSALWAARHATYYAALALRPALTPCVC